MPGKELDARAAAENLPSVYEEASLDFAERYNDIILGAVPDIADKWQAGAAEQLRGFFDRLLRDDDVRDLAKRAALSFWERRRLRAAVNRQFGEVKYMAEFDRRLIAVIASAKVRSARLYREVIKEKVKIRRAGLPTGYAITFEITDTEARELSELRHDGFTVGEKVENLFAGAEGALKAKVFRAIEHSRGVLDARDAAEKAVAGQGGMIDQWGVGLRRYLLGYFNEVYALAVGHLRGEVKIKR